MKILLISAFLVLAFWGENAKGQTIKYENTYDEGATNQPQVLVNLQGGWSGCNFPPGNTACVPGQQGTCCNGNYQTAYVIDIGAPHYGVVYPTTCSRRASCNRSQNGDPAAGQAWTLSVDKTYGINDLLKAEVPNLICDYPDLFTVCTGTVGQCSQSTNTGMRFTSAGFCMEGALADATPSNERCCSFQNNPPNTRCVWADTQCANWSQCFGDSWVWMSVFYTIQSNIIDGITFEFYRCDSAADANKKLHCHQWPFLSYAAQSNTTQATVDLFLQGRHGDYFYPKDCGNWPNDPRVIIHDYMQVTEFPSNHLGRTIVEPAYVVFDLAGS